MQFKNAINGRFAKLWVDNEEWLEVKSFNATLAIDREEVKFNGSFEKGSKLKDLTGSGKFVVSHIYTRMTKKILDKIKNGEDLIFKVTSSLEDKDQVGGQYEKFSISQCWSDQLVLADWEQDKILEQEFSYGFNPMSASFIETIDVA